MNNNINNTNDLSNSTNTSGVSDVNTTLLQAAPTTNTMQVAAPPSDASSTSGAGASQILCDKCGTYYPSNQRYCMKCGALNYSHPDNQSMKQYINYDMVNHNLVDSNNTKLLRNIDPEITRKRTCMLVNLFLHVIVGILVTVLLVLGKETSIMYFATVWIICLIFFIENYSMCLIYIHAGEKWWNYYIPFYSQYIYYKITMDNGLFFLLSGIPIFPLIASYKLGTRFERSGWLTMLFSPVMIPIIAFTSNSYGGSLKSMHMNIETDFDSKGRTKSERQYGVKKKLITVIVLILLVVIVYFTYPYILKYGKILIDFLIDNFNEFMDFIEKYN